MVGVRFDPSAVDAEAELEAAAVDRPVSRSEMIKTLLDEALTAREKRRKRQGR